MGTEGLESRKYAVEDKQSCDTFPLGNLQKNTFYKK